MTQIPRPLNEIYSIFEQTLLGKGSTGNVYLGCVKGNPNQKVAIKSINLHQINNEVTRYLLSCEIAALSNLGKLQNTQHENVVRLLQIVILDNFIYLVMQLLQGGTLAEYIKKYPDGLPEEEALCILKQILQGYQRIKNKSIVHRDLKPDNIIFKVEPHQSKNVAIIDFGYCEMKQVPNKPMMFYNVGSPKYMSPQAYKENKYSQKSDIWAIGVILYEMLLGKTCDNGMNMQSYLQMLQTKGIPLPVKLKNIHKHLLTRMLAYNPASRIQCDEALKILNHHLNSFQRPSTNNFVLSNQGQQNLKDILEMIPSERPKRNNVVFNSTLQLARSPSTNNIQHEQTFQTVRLLKKEPGLSQSYKNLQEIRMIERNPAISFYNEQSKIKRVFLPQRINKLQNVDFSSAKQIIHRNQTANHMIQIKNLNVTPFHLPFKEGSFQNRFTTQNLSQPTINFQISPTNQRVNQQIKVNQFPSLLRASNPSTHKQEQAFSKILSQSGPQNINVLKFTNLNQKVIINPIQFGGILDVQNNNQPKLRKQASQDAQFVALKSVRNNLFGRQSQEIPRSSFPQNKIHTQNFYKPRASYDATLTKNPFSDLSQSVMPHQDLTMTRAQYQNFQQNATPLTDLAQTKISTQILINNSTVGKTPSAVHESNTYQKPIVQQQTSLSFIKRQQQPSQKIKVNKIQNKPFQTVRKVVHLKPQTAAIRKIENKTNYMRLNAYPQTIYRQEAHLMMLHPSVVK